MGSRSTGRGSDRAFTVIPHSAVKQVIYDSVNKMSNNTTAETCINALNETIDCIPLDTSSLFDDIEVVLLAVAALLGILAWGI
jgi:hypothetical protein